jgi:hypothetical protein
MPLTTYTSYAEIRAVLGVSSTELTDAALSQQAYYTLFILALEDIDVAIPGYYDTISALPTPSTSETRFIDLVNLFAAYSTAKELLTSLPLFSVKELTDGRASFARQSDPYQAVRDGIEATFETLRLRIATLYNTLANGTSTVGTRTLPTLTIGATLATDPVTNA